MSHCPAHDAIKAGKSLGADAIVIADEHGQLDELLLTKAVPAQLR
jgi:hypothetical protein